MNVCKYLPLLRWLDLYSGVTIQDKNGATPLYFAAQEGHASVTKQLIEATCNINLQDVDGTTPLHAAAKSGHVAIAQLLLAARYQQLMTRSHL